MRARALGWAGAFAVVACSSGFQVNLDGFCRGRPDSPECPPQGGSAGVSGEGGVGGASGIGGSGGASGLGGGGTGGAGGLVCQGTKVDCGGACVDLKADDATNCGACGRSCLGATCTQGACVPEALAEGEVAPYALADDGTYLYWVSPAVKANDAAFRSRVRRVAKGGGAAEPLFGSTEVRARSLAFAGGKLYWGDLGASPSDVANQRLVAGTPGTGECCTTVAAGQPGIEHVALAGGKVYWLIGGGGGAVRGKSADGTGGITPEVFGQVNPSWLSVDGDAAPYWVAVDAAGTGREVRRAVSASAAEPAASGSVGLRAVELSGERFYWADGAAVRSRPKASPSEAPRDELTSAGKVEGFAVVAVGAGGAAGAAGAGGAGGAGEPTLYVLTAEGRQLRAWRKGPDDAEALLLGEVTAKAAAYGGNPFGAAYVLVDAQYVYFADVGTVDTTPDVDTSEGDGVVHRVAR